MKQLSKLMLISLTLISLMTQSVLAEVTVLPLAPPPVVTEQPKCLNPAQMKSLANREIQCQKYRSDLILTQKAYEDAIKSPATEQWWADPKIVVGGFVITATLTSLLTYVIVNESNK